MLLEIVFQSLADGGLYGTDDLVVAEFRLCLTLKLRLEHLHRNHCSKSFAEVVAGDVDFYLFEHLRVFGIFLERKRQAATEARQVCSAFYGVDVVDKRKNGFVERCIVGERNLYGYALALRVDVDNIVDELLFGLVDVANKLFQALFRVEHFPFGIALLVFDALIGKRQTDSGIQICQVAQTICQRIEVVNGSFGKYRFVRLENHRRTRFGRLTNDCHRRFRMSVGIFLHIQLAVAANFCAQIFRQSVDTRHTNAVQTARNLIRTFVELTAGMQHGHYDLERRLVQFGMLINRNTATVVDNFDGIVFADCYFNVIGKSCKRLVD